MAGSVNRAIIVGRAGKDAQVKTFANGGRIVEFSIATSRKWTDRSSGERKEDTTWHAIVVTDKMLGEVAEKWVRKGSQVYIEGEIRNRSYEKNGETRYVSEVVVPPFQGSLVMLDGRAGGDEPSREEAPRTPARTDPRGNPRWDEGDEPIPF